MKFKEVDFENDKIVLYKKSGDVVIKLNEIERIEYVKPTILNYLLCAIAPGSTTFPVRLEIRTKVKIGRSKLHLVKIKHKEVVKLPKEILDIIDPLYLIR